MAAPAGNAKQPFELANGEPSTQGSDKRKACTRASLAPSRATGTATVPAFSTALMWTRICIVAM